MQRPVECRPIADIPPPIPFVLLEPNQVDELLQSTIKAAPTFFPPYQADKLTAEAAPKAAMMKKIDFEPEPEFENEPRLF